MKTFVLFALTLCVAQCEMSRNLFKERGQRFKSLLDQVSHHRAGIAGAERSIRQLFRRKLGHHRAAFPEELSFRSNRLARSAVIKEHGSGYIEFVVGNTANIDVTLGSGSSSGSSSGFGSGFGSGSSPITLTNGIKTEESQVQMLSKNMHTCTGIHGTQSSSGSGDRKAGSNNSNNGGGIISVLSAPSHKVKRSVVGFPGSGDAGSGGSSSGEVYNIAAIQENSGSDVIEEVVINSDNVIEEVVINSNNVIQIQFAQGGSDSGSESVATSPGSGSESVATSPGSGSSVACIGAGCDQGSGSIEVHDAHIKLDNASVQRISVTGDESQSSGMNPVANQP